MAKNPKVRCFNVEFGGGARASIEREGKTFWPHSIDIEMHHPSDVERLVMSGIRWLTENGAKPVMAREPFLVQTMGEIAETDPETGEPLKRQI